MLTVSSGGDIMRAAMRPDTDSIGHVRREEFTRRVRGTAFWAAIAGGLMLYFGRFEFESRLDSQVYAAAIDARMWTLRIGGGCMLFVTVLCLAGSGVGLLVDALACAGVAVMLALTGGAFLINRDSEGILSLIFALVFGAAGWRSWQDYRARPRAVTDGFSAPSAECAGREPAEPVAGTGHHAIVEAMRKRRGQESPTPPATPSVPLVATPEARVSAAAPPPVRSSAAPASPVSSPNEPAEGFLAALAREEKERGRT